MDNKTKVLFVFEVEMPTVGIIRNQWNNLDNSFNIVAKFVRLPSLSLADLNWCDILFIIRPNNSLSWRIAKKVHNSGRLVVTACDDDLLNLPKSHVDFSWRRRGLIKALNYSSVVVSSNKHLVEKYKEFTLENRGVLTDTIVRPDELFCRSFGCRNNRPVRIVYAAGGGQHEKVFEDMVLPALKVIAGKTPSCFSLTFISVHPNCEQLSGLVSVEYVEGMSLQKYREYMKDNVFDIGLSPLSSDAFSRCKYYNKYIEYSLTGIVGVYSNVEPYTYVIKDEVNGFLADNNINAWEIKLLQAIEDASLRAVCAINAQKHILESFSEKTVMEKLFVSIPELKGSGRRRYTKCKGFLRFKVIYGVLRAIELLFKTVVCLRTEGFTSVIEKIKTRLRSFH